MESKILEEQLNNEKVKTPGTDIGSNNEGFFTSPYDKIKASIIAGMNPNSALEKALSTDNLVVVKCLLEEYRDQLLLTPTDMINEAVKKGHVKILKHFFDSIKLMDKHIKELTLDAIAFNQVEVLKFLLNYTSLDIPQIFQMIPVLCQNKQKEMIVYLADYPGIEIQKLIETCFYNDYPEVLEFLKPNIEKRIERDWTKEPNQSLFTMLDKLVHLAMKIEHFEYINWLANSPCVNFKQLYDWTKVDTTTMDKLINCALDHGVESKLTQSLIRVADIIPIVRQAIIKFNTFDEVKPLIVQISNEEQLKKAIQTAIREQKPDILQQLHLIGLKRNLDMSEIIKKWVRNWTNQDNARNMLEFLNICWQEPESQPLQSDSEPESKPFQPTSSEPQDESGLQYSSCNY